MEFGVLGPLRVLVDGRDVKLPGHRPRAVLGVLLAYAGESVSVPALIDQVWGERPPPTVATALQMHIGALRKVVGDRIVTTSSGYRLDTDPGAFDAHRFERAVTGVDVLRRPDQSVSRLIDALSWWRGEPYADVRAGSAVQAARLRLVELRRSADESRLEAMLLLGRHTEAVSQLAGLVADHPARERLTSLHMLALYRCGRVADAHEAFTRFQEALRTHLGAAPGDAVVALDRAIARRDPTLTAPTGLAAPVSRFIGRRRELDDLADRLGRTRLLTVTGVGGVGKTRLAVELARELVDDHPDGTHLVELAPLPAGSAVAERVAAALDVRVDTLATHIGGARMLMLLDNCEHVADDCARVVGDLLAACPGLRVLATSREPLGVAGEVIAPITGLTAHEEAVRLLADRGAAVRAGFTVTATDADTAVRLCKRLDGLPLAIELAAAQLRTRSLAEVANRPGGLDLTDTRSRDLPDRHRTMRTAIEWSHQLLSPEERRVFHRLAVFVGGFTTDAALAVTEASEDVLARLADKSLITFHGPRWGMLELVRDFAAENLTDETRRAHAHWYAELAESTAYGGTGHTRAVGLLEAEEPNLRAALDWCPDPALVLRIASPLWWYWSSRGLTKDALRWLRKAPAPSALRDSALRATLSSR